MQNKSSYVNLSPTFPDTNPHRVCKCLPANAYGAIGVWKWGKQVTCPDGRKFNCTSDSPFCMRKVCNVSNAGFRSSPDDGYRSGPLPSSRMMENL